MTSDQFAYWLQGFFELSDSNQLSEKQVRMIKEHLQLVFTKVTSDGKAPEDETFCADIAARDDATLSPQQQSIREMTDLELTHQVEIMLRKYSHSLTTMRQADHQFYHAVILERQRRKNELKKAGLKVQAQLDAAWDVLTPEEKAKRLESVRIETEKVRAELAKPKQPMWSPYDRDRRIC